MRSIAGRRRDAILASVLLRSTFPTKYRPTRPRSISMGPGRTSRPTAMSGIRGRAPGGAPTTTAAGRRCGPGAGRGLDRIRGRGRLTTMGDGVSRPAGGSGFLDAPGARRGCRGHTRPATSAGVRSDGTTVPCSGSMSVGTAAIATTIGMAGPSCRIGGFGRGYVNANVINSTHIDVRTRNTFVVRDAAPDVRGYAVPRASAPIRSVGAPNGAVVNGNTAGNAAAYRGSRTRTAPGTAATADGDSTAAFRSRRSSSAPLSGSGYPAPARAPRSTSPAIARAPGNGVGGPRRQFGRRVRPAFGRRHSPACRPSWFRGRRAVDAL